MPRWNHLGTKLVYSFVSNAHEPTARQQLQLFDVSTGDDRPLTSPHDPNKMMEFPTGWTPDGRQVIVVSGDAGGPSAIGLFPIDRAPASERSAPIITSSADAAISVAVMSPDGRWIAFRARRNMAGPGRIAVVSAKGGDPSTWIFVTAGDYPADKPVWSDDGAILYFLSLQGPATNVWGTRFDSVRGAAVGEPVGGGRLVVPVVRPKGGLWLLERPNR